MSDNIPPEQHLSDTEHKALGELGNFNNSTQITEYLTNPEHHQTFMSAMEKLHSRSDSDAQQMLKDFAIEERIDKQIHNASPAASGEHHQLASRGDHMQAANGDHRQGASGDHTQAAGNQETAEQRAQREARDDRHHMATYASTTADQINLSADTLSVEKDISKQLHRFEHQYKDLLSANPRLEEDFKQDLVKFMRAQGGDKHTFQYVDGMIKVDDHLVDEKSFEQVTTKQSDQDKPIRGLKSFEK